jgi:hypothetical protein
MLALTREDALRLVLQIKSHRKVSMQRNTVLIAMATLVVSTSLYAQQATPAPAPDATPVVAAPATPPAPAAPPAATTAPLILRDGTDVPLKFAQDISSKTAAEGDSVTFVLDSDLKVGDVVVAKAGCRAVGEVTKASKSGMMGKAGDLSIRLDYLKVGDQKVRLRGNKGKEGESGATGAVVLTVLFGPIGLIKHGKNVEIKSGASFPAFVSDDITLPPAS